ncbi:SRPBCC family protein [Elizabethkingia argentiflava]|uniref:SRPBCC family protein n=1 Tax=Elizabethkingia argenteiflava TaxID=2681556 RepID=A0A845Q1B6_9FLAO|nr:SRPBCC family protein [Elizabethkingia argenteiflava]NAW52120.1 SRPBCC family protein [Elizabethkingia argenteiflava]
MNLEGRKIIVNKSVSELKEILKKPNDYRSLMPDNLKAFEAKEGEFNFELSGMPKIALRIQEVNDQQVVLSSASSSLNFSLRGTMNALNTTQTEVQLLFDGAFNPLIKMMVEKPLQSFINSVTDKIEHL